jgi:hypothetical protein
MKSEEIYMKSEYMEPQREESYFILNPYDGVEPFSASPAVEIFLSPEQVNPSSDSNLELNNKNEDGSFTAVKRIPTNRWFLISGIVYIKNYLKNKHMLVHCRWYRSVVISDILTTYLLTPNKTATDRLMTRMLTLPSPTVTEGLTGYPTEELNTQRSEHLLKTK